MRSAASPFASSRAWACCRATRSPRTSRRSTRTAAPPCAGIGVRFGAFHIFVPRPAQAGGHDRCACCCGRWSTSKDGRIRHRELAAESPGQGLTSVAFDRTTPRGFYRIAGFRICGERAVRIDMLERLADTDPRAGVLASALPGRAAPAGLGRGRRLYHRPRHDVAGRLLRRGVHRRSCVHGLSEREAPDRAGRLPRRPATAEPPRPTLPRRPTFRSRRPPAIPARASRPETPARAIRLPPIRRRPAPSPRSRRRPPADPTSIFQAERPGDRPTPSCPCPRSRCRGRRWPNRCL